MPRYEYKCTTCDEHFEVWRSMAEADTATYCEAGHQAKRLLSMFASSGFAKAGASAGVSAPLAMGGGCGSGCGCAH